MKKFNTILLAMTILAASLTGCAANNEDTLVVGLEAAYAPFNWTDSSSNEFNVVLDNVSGAYVDGYDVQIAVKIAESLNKKLVIRAIEWDGLIPAVQSGTIDLIIAGMSDTEERRQNVLFTNAYYTTTHVMLVRADGKFANATNLNGFSGATLVGQRGTLYDDLIDQVPNAIHATPLESVPSIVTNILSGVSDGTVLELPVANAIVITNPQLKFIQFAEGQGFNVSLSDRQVAIALGLGKESLRNDINAVLNSISESERQRLMSEATDRQPG
jgi:ABC-type amino acid transport substrate-binding protein